MKAMTGQILDELLNLADELIDADLADTAGIAALQGRVAELTRDVEDFRDPDRAVRIQRMIDKLASRPAAGWGG